MLIESNCPRASRGRTGVAGRLLGATVARVDLQTGRLPPPPHPPVSKPRCSGRRTGQRDSEAALPRRLLSVAPLISTRVRLSFDALSADLGDGFCS